MYKNNWKVILMPLILALAIVLGMFVNSLFVGKDLRERQELFLPVQGSKLDMVLNMVEHSYVDTVDIQKIEENAINEVIKDLDPHTVYIPAKEMEKVNEDMIGNFGGIGVQFYKYRDTVTVIKVVPGGPSQDAGLQDGDRIIKVNDTLVAGGKNERSENYGNDAGTDWNGCRSYPCKKRGENSFYEKNYPGKYSGKKCRCRLYGERHDRVYKSEYLWHEYL